MRTFIAIELPKEIKEALASLQQGLKNSGADVKWVQPENIHLTLKFLGEIDEQVLAKIINILEVTAENQNSFYLNLSSLGAFPNMNFPRVIWIGIKKGDSQIQEVASKLEKEISGIGIPKENRAFSSHITLGRVKSGLNRDKLTKKLNELAGNFLKEGSCAFPVKKITLFKSTLTPQGPIYEILKEVPLK
jgi:2'-5' RNA ligase